MLYEDPLQKLKDCKLMNLQYIIDQYCKTSSKPVRVERQGQGQLPPSGIARPQSLNLFLRTSCLFSFRLLDGKGHASLMNFCNLEPLRYYDDLAMLLYLTECILHAVFVCTSHDDNVNYFIPAIQQKDGSNFHFSVRFLNSLDVCFLYLFLLYNLSPSCHFQSLNDFGSHFSLQLLCL